MLEVEAGQPRQRQHGRIQLGSLGHLLHPRHHVAADVRHFEGGIERQQLRLPARAAGRDHRARGQVLHGQSRLEPAPRRLAGRPFGGGFVRLGGAKVIRVAIDQHVAHVGALADSAEREARGQFGRQVFQAVHRQVGAMLEQRDFQFLGEEALGQALAFLRQRSGLELVAGGLDDLQLEAQLRESGAALGQDQVGLGQRQGAAAGGDGDGFIGRHCEVKALKEPSGLNAAPGSVCHGPWSASCEGVRFTLALTAGCETEPDCALAERDPAAPGPSRE